MFDTETEFLSPSLHIEGLTCSRRLWLRYHHVAIDEARQWKNASDWLKNSLDEELKYEWKFDLRFPTGSKMDAWIPDEHVCLLLKLTEPHASHVYQAWMSMEEFERLGIKGAEFQLWYPAKWSHKAKKLAETMNLDSGKNDAGMYAVALNEPDADFKFRRERDAAIFMGDLEKPEPPAVKNRDKSPCRTCSFFEFCHC